MDAEPVACPLCGAIVTDAPDPKGASDVHALERHFAKSCPARVAP